SEHGAGAATYCRRIRGGPRPLRRQHDSEPDDWSAHAAGRQRIVRHEFGTAHTGGDRVQGSRTIFDPDVPGAAVVNLLPCYRHVRAESAGILRGGNYYEKSEELGRIRGRNRIGRCHTDRYAVAA